MSGEDIHHNEEQQSLEGGIQSLADMPSFSEHMAEKSKEQNKSFPEKLNGIERTVNNYANEVLDSANHRYGGDCRAYYDSMPEGYKGIIDGLRFFEDAEVILDHDGEAFQHLVDIYDEGYHDWSRINHMKGRIPTEAVASLEGKLSESEEMHLSWIRYGWHDGYDFKESGIPGLEQRMSDFINLGRKMLGEESKEMLRILDELNTKGGGADKGNLKIVRKIKYRLLNKAEDDQNDGEPIRRGSDVTFGKLLDYKSGEWADGVIAPSYGSVGSLVLQGAYGGKYYNAPKDTHKNNQSSAPSAENSNSNDRKPEVKMPEDFGFRDWGSN